MNVFKRGLSDKGGAASKDVNSTPASIDEEGFEVIDKRHDLLGGVDIEFKQGNKLTKTKALVGQPISEVAADADVFIKYKCKKGECGTCSIMVSLSIPSFPLIFPALIIPYSYTRPR